jgi:hypothetical protein
MTKKDRDASARAGIGLRLPHLAEVVATQPAAGWFEIHPENFLANPHARELLLQLSERYPISVHTVGVSIGSACGIDRDHLSRVRALVDRINPFLVSGHLAWSTHKGEYLNDLLPLPYNEETLRLVARHVDEVQDGLGRPYLIENPSSYIGIASSTMNEVEFLGELVRRTGCRLLCDVSNVYVSGHNLGYDPYAYLDGFPAEAIDELHLGGFTAEDDEASPGAQVLVDTHNQGIAEPVWDLYAHAVRRFGPKPTLIEWDNDIPALDAILSEADKADAVAAATLIPERRHAVAR